MIKQLRDKVLNGVPITKAEVMDVLLNAELNVLTGAADKIRSELCGDKVDLCSIANGKCSRCSEDCIFCVQSCSAASKLNTHGFIDRNTYVDACKKAAENQIDCFSIVTSGRALNDEDYKTALELYSAAKKEVGNILQCASHGLLTKEQLMGLKKVGVSRYHANVETSERYFPYICTTHTYADKIRLVKDAQSVGLEVCSGGIIGIGETMEDRIDMAFTLKELHIKSIPINIFIPFDGVPISVPTPSYEEILRVVAIFRFINPTAQIRLAAGRNFMGDNGLKAFRSGANAAITGNMLNASGSDVSEDIDMLINNGLTVGGANAK